MIAKKPQDRQQSMTQVIADLQACGISTGQRAEEHARGHRGSGGAGRQTAGRCGRFRRAAPIPSLIDEWLVEEPAVLSERWLPPTWRTVQQRARRRRLWVWCGVLASVLLAWLIVYSSLPSRNIDSNAPASSEAILVVTVSQADALIQVVDGQDKVLALRKGGLEPVSLFVDPGEYRLRVEKTGFRTADQPFSIQRGQRLETHSDARAAGQGQRRKAPVACTNYSVPGTQVPSRAGCAGRGVDKTFTRMPAQPARRLSASLPPPHEPDNLLPRLLRRRLQDHVRGGQPCDDHLRLGTPDRLHARGRISRSLAPWR